MSTPAEGINPPETTNVEPPASDLPQPTTAQPTQIHSTPPKPLESQPMTATSSSSSNQPIKVAAPSDTNIPSPYGTRSRNRTGAARPNYAEDRETDMEYEYTGPPKHSGLLSTIRITKASSTESDKPSGLSTRRTSASANNPAAVNGSVASVSQKDYIPGMSTFSANPNITITSQTSSKKRKAPGSAPASTPHQSLNPTSNGVQTSTRRGSTAVNSAAVARETNMLSFENCQGYLKNGKLKADDGTTLSVEGM